MEWCWYFVEALVVGAGDVQRAVQVHRVILCDSRRSADEQRVRERDRARPRMQRAGQREAGSGEWRRLTGPRTLVRAPRIVGVWRTVPRLAFPG